MIRGQVSTDLAAPLSASRLIGSTRRSAHSYCWDSSDQPAGDHQQPGPGQDQRGDADHDEHPADDLEADPLGRALHGASLPDRQLAA